MRTPLRTLLIDDSEDDAALLLRELQRGGYDPQWARVETAAELADALDRQDWDVITCDWVMPDFGGEAALAFLKERGADVPIIVVSGEVGEELAVTVMKRGAHDFISKQRLARLCPAVERELGETQQRRALKEAEASLRTSEERFRRYFELGLIGMAITSPTKGCIEVNDHICAILGYTRGELLQMNWAEVTHPDDLAADEAQFNRVLARECDGYSMDKRFIRKDGQIVYAAISVKCVRRVDGSVDFFVALLQDITERHHAEVASRNQAQLLACILDSVGDGVIVADATGKLLYSNPVARHIAGRALADTPWQEWPEQFGLFSLDGVLLPAEQVPLRQAIQGARFENQEMAIRPYGSDALVPLSVTGAPLLAHDNTPRGGVVVFRDVSDAKEAEKTLRQVEARNRAQLEAINKELEAFSHSVSHDLRAPLRHIEGFSRALLEEYGPQLGDAGRGYLDRIRSATNRLEQLIESLLGLSRVTRAEMVSDVVQLSDVARTIAGELQSSEPGRQVQFVIAPEVIAQGDPRLLRIALENLLGNAWKYTSKHATARIEFGLRSTDRGTQESQFIQSDSQPVYFVRDDGAGFDMKYSAKLFGVFQRLHKPSDFEGAGIGLATVARIIHRHGGRIWADSAPQKGATFYFTLPPAPTPS